ncbi:MAG: tetratricopeptide repeat protein [Candidatus Pacebacteria bacterium]|nr:tetratricopeptide repeat protein [Candidatus Paceibacterota bacterium]
MTFDLMPQIIIIISTGIIIVILGRNISKVRNLNEENLFFHKEEDKEEKEKFFYLYSRIKKRINKEEYKKKINLMWVWLEKILRKTRIRFLKIDNKIISLLDKLREKHEEIEIDKSEETDSFDKYEDVKEKIEEGQAKEKDSEFLQKEAGIVENELQKNEALGNMDNDKIVESTDSGEKENDASKFEKDAKEEIEAYAKKENAKGKEKEYINIILKNPIDIKAYWKLGIIYSRRKNYKDAISCFRQITKIDPTYTKAKKKIVDLMERMKDKKENKKKAKEEKKIMKKDVDIQEKEEKKNRK